MNHHSREKSFREKIDILLIPPVMNVLNQFLLKDFQSLGLLALQAGLVKNGYNTEIYSPGNRLINESDFIETASDVLSYNPALIGFSTWCVTYPASLLIAKHIKTLQPEIPVVFGGPQASLLGKETLMEFRFVDYVLGGECDYTFPQFVRLLFNGYDENKLLTISGLTFRSSAGKIIQNRLRSVIMNLDELPFPSYSPSNSRESLLLDVGRGCPFKCTYCSTNEFFSKTYRTKSPERIITEMDMAFDKFGICHFDFSHDMFTLNKSFIHDLCNKLVNLSQQRNRKYFWNCSARIDCVSHDLLKLMKEAGCKAIFFGIESGSEKIQKSIKKNLKIRDVYKTAETCRLIGIEMYASFIIGFPDETEEDIEKTLQCIVNLSIQGVFTQVSELSLLPGTPLYKQYKEYLKFDGRFSNFSCSFCGVEEIKLIAKYPGIFSSFYYLPVTPIDRYSRYLMQNLINLLGQFRNTLFILKEFLKSDLENTNLLLLSEKHLINLKTQVNKGAPVITYLVNQMKNYLATKKVSEINPFIYDVFAFESIKALMLAKFARWQLIKPQIERMKQAESSDTKSRWMQPTPFWQILTTSHALKSILPSGNGWITSNIKTRKGTYHYLVIAVSERICNLYKITSKENVILKNLADNMASKTKNEFTDMMNGIKINAFWKRMTKLGVVEIKD